MKDRDLDLRVKKERSLFIRNSILTGTGFLVFISFIMFPKGISVKCVALQGLCWVAVAFFRDLQHLLDVKIRCTRERVRKVRRRCERRRRELEQSLLQSLPTTTYLQ